ncbi:MAG: hypothetical protein AB1938_00920 [Myxococcota bacterium]
MGLMTIRTFAVGALLVGSAAGATALEKSFLSTNATCNCKGPGDCTCPKGQCKCKKCGNGARPGAVIKTLQGSPETTRLPDTARHDAHGGVFI